VHTDEAAEEYEPSAHAVHVDAPLDTPVEEPGVHCVHTEKPVPMA
jgi:hypothetical protein